MLRIPKLFSILFLLAGSAIVAPATESTDRTERPAERHVAVVSPKAFHRSLEPWIRHRTSQGYRVHVLVEPFGEEATTPQKVKDRIRLLAEQVPLSAVLLVGNGAVRTPGQSDRVIPSPRFACQIIQHFGEESHFASDDWYVDLDGDGWADLAVGRFPAATPEELETMIRKTLRYETEIETGTWCRRIQIVAGVGGFSSMIDGVIESTARYALTQTLPGSWEIALLHAHRKSPFCPAWNAFGDELTETINRSPLFWVYLGHGRHRMFEPLGMPFGPVTTLHADRFPTLQCRESSPIALLFCCYGGMLDVETPSMAEEMLLQPEGPVAALAASRTAMPYGMSIFGIEFLQEYLERQTKAAPRKATLGSLVVVAKQRMLRPRREIDSSAQPPRQRGVRQRPFRDNLETWAKLLDPFPAHLDVQLREHAALFHLFGDPLLEIPLPGMIRLDCPDKIKAGKTLRVEGSLDRSAPAVSGTVLLELAASPARFSLTSSRRETDVDDAERLDEDNREYRSANEYVLSARKTAVSGNSFVVELPVPEKLRGEFIVRAFLSSSDSFALGAATVHVVGR